MDDSTLRNWLWEAACTIRGPIDAPKFKDYILPLVFLKRLSDVFDDEVAGLGAEFKDPKKAERLVEKDHKLVRFYLPEKARWPTIVAKTAGLGEYLTDAVRAVARENPKLQGVIDLVDFNATTAGQRIADDPRLVRLVQVLGQHRLGLKDVDPDLFGQAYEYLLRKFSEGSGSSAGEFFTPPEAAMLMARILEPEPGMTVYDPCCGSGGLLIKAHLRLVEKYGVKKNGSKVLPSSVAPLRLFGQDIGSEKYAMTCMNAVIHDMTAEVSLSDTMHKPAFRGSDGRLQRFDLVVANPMWNQDFPTSTYENDPFERFKFGVPPASTADWGWIQHMYASLKDGGRMAVVLDSGSVSRGSGNQGSNRERDIRRAFVEADLVEAVILLPENLFYNTTAPGIVLVVNRRKTHKGEILLVNASALFTKGRPKNEMRLEHLDKVANAFRTWNAIEGLCAVVSNTEAVKNDYNLSPGRYVATGAGEATLPLEEAVVLLREAEEERQDSDRALKSVLRLLGLDGGDHA